MHLPGLTYSNVVASLALFIALGGTSYAITKLPRNSVASPQVKDGSLQPRDLAASARGAGPRGPRGPEGPRGPDGARGAQGERGPVSVRFAKPAANVAMSTVAGQPRLVRRMDNVPAGAWLLRFDGNAYLDVDAATHVGCVVKVNGDYVASNAVVVGNSAIGTREASLPVEVPVQRSAPFNVTVDCHVSVGTSPPSYVNHPQITATQVAEVIATP